MSVPNKMKMGKKKSQSTRQPDPQKTPKVWERARREKMKIYFQELMEILPVYDPATPMSRFDVLQKATSFIKDLQAQNQDLLNGGFDDVYREKMEKLKLRIKELVRRVDQLTDLLRMANITVPPSVPYPDPGSAKSTCWLNQRPKKWTEKLSMVVPNDKIDNVLFVIKNMKKKSTKKKDEKKKPKRLSDKSKGGKKTLGCDVRLGSAKENNPMHLAKDDVSKVITSAPAELPKLDVVMPDPPVYNTIPSNAPSNTFILANGSLVPILNSNASVFNQSSSILTPVLINRPSPLIVVQKPAPPIIQTTQIVNIPKPGGIQILSNPVSFLSASQPNVASSTANPLPYLMSKPPANKRRVFRDSTMTTYVNKIPIPALSKQSYLKKPLLTSTKPKKKEDEKQKELTVKVDSATQVNEIPQTNPKDDSRETGEALEVVPYKRSADVLKERDLDVSNSAKKTKSSENCESFKPIETPAADILSLPVGLNPSLSVSPTAQFLSTFPIVAPSKAELEEEFGQKLSKSEGKEKQNQICDAHIVKEVSKEEIREAGKDWGIFPLSTSPQIFLKSPAPSKPGSAPLAPPQTPPQQFPIPPISSQSFSISPASQSFVTQAVPSSFPAPPISLKPFSFPSTTCQTLGNSSLSSPALSLNTVNGTKAASVSYNKHSYVNGAKKTEEGTQTSLHLAVQTPVQSQRRAQMEPMQSPHTHLRPLLQTNLQPQPHVRSQGQTSTPQTTALPNQPKPLTASQTSLQTKSLSLKSAQPPLVSHPPSPLQPPLLSQSQNHLPLQPPLLSQSQTHLPLQPPLLSQSQTHLSLQPPLLSQSQTHLSLQPPLLSQSQTNFPLQPPLLSQSQTHLPLQPPLLSQSQTHLPLQPPLLSQSQTHLSLQPPLLSQSQTHLPLQPPLLSQSQTHIPLQPTLLSQTKAQTQLQPPLVSQTQNQTSLQPLLLYQSSNQTPLQPMISQSQNQTLLPPPMISQSQNQTLLPPPMISQSQNQTILPPPMLSQSQNQTLLPPPMISQSQNQTLLPPPLISQPQHQTTLQPLLPSQSHQILLPPPSISQPQNQTLLQPLLPKNQTLLPPPLISQSHQILLPPPSISQSQKQTLLQPLLPKNQTLLPPPLISQSQNQTSLPPALISQSQTQTTLQSLTQTQLHPAVLAHSQTQTQLKSYQTQLQAQTRLQFHPQMQIQSQMQTHSQPNTQSQLQLQAAQPIVQTQSQHSQTPSSQLQSQAKSQHPIVQSQKQVQSQPSIQTKPPPQLQMQQPQHPLQTAGTNVTQPQSLVKECHTQAKYSVEMPGKPCDTYKMPMYDAGPKYQLIPAKEMHSVQVQGAQIPAENLQRHVRAPVNWMTDNTFYHNTMPPKPYESNADTYYGKVDKTDKKQQDKCAPYKSGQNYNIFDYNYNSNCYNQEEGKYCNTNNNNNNYNTKSKKNGSAGPGNAKKKSELAMHYVGPSLPSDTKKLPEQTRQVAPDHYNSANPTAVPTGNQDCFSWVPAKTMEWLPNKCSFGVDSNLIVPCTLPTLVGDLALGTNTVSDMSQSHTAKNTKSCAVKLGESDNLLEGKHYLEPFTNLSKNIFDVTNTTEKPTYNTNGSINETIVLKNIFDLPTSKNFSDFQNQRKQRSNNQSQNNFLSVSQLVENQNFENMKTDHLEPKPVPDSYEQGYNFHGNAGKHYKNKRGYKYERKFSTGYKNTSYTAEALIRSSSSAHDFNSDQSFFHQKNSKPDGFNEINSGIYTDFNFSSPVPNLNIPASTDVASFENNISSQNSSFLSDFVPSEYPLSDSVSNSLLLPPCSIGFQNPFIMSVDKKNAAEKSTKKNYARSRRNFECSKMADPIFTNSTVTCPPIFTTTSTCQNLLPLPSHNGSDASITFTAPSIAFPSNSNLHKFPPPSTTSNSFMPSSTVCVSTSFTTSVTNSVISTPFSVGNVPLSTSSQSSLPFLSLPGHSVIIPPSVPSTTGNSLANFNLSTIFPEINEKGSYHYP